ncbi:MAG TPA: hypothetical protein VNY34_02040, partial [Solirubrobacteraceae bacterium]|nr:hypothetical protein [Solirubrobacteraceae bacterium]
MAIDPVADGRWDAFVHAHPRATSHHLGAWASILGSCYGYRPKYIALESDQRLTGVLPLVGSGRRLTGSRLSSLPTARAAGPLGASPDDERALLTAAAEIRRRERIGSLTVRSEAQGLQVDGMRIASTDVSHVLELGPSDEELLESYKHTSQNLYRSIRKAEKSDLIVEESRAERDLRVWYRLYVKTIRKHHNL